MKTVLITGANRGLGLGFTRHYLDSGWRVFATARSPGESTEFEALGESFDGRFTALELDLSRPGSIDTLASGLHESAFDLVINNAGTLPDEAFGEWTPEAFGTAFAVNATGPALVAQAVLPALKRGALLVNLSSGLGSCELNIDPESGLDAYSASKTALNMLTRRLAAKLAPRGVTVVAIDPGWVRTRMGGENADLSIGESIGAITGTIESLTPEQSGLFLSRKGECLPW